MFRYWDGKAWSAATSPNPNAQPPSPGLGATPRPATPYGTGHQGTSGAYANFQAQAAKKTSMGWWIGAGALFLVIIVVGVLAIRGIAGEGTFGNPVPGSNPSQDACPDPKPEPETPAAHPNDGRVHGGPLSYPRLGSPWSEPMAEHRVPFGIDVREQMVDVESNYGNTGNNWVASVLVGELAAGDGFFTPEQGAGIVVKCIVGAFYGDNEVERNDTVNKATTVDGHDAWIVESQLTFDIEGLKTKGELLIVVIVENGVTAGLYYASIPDTTPELVQPARQVLAQLKVSS